jgi:hypothetical protein
MLHRYLTSIFLFVFIGNANAQEDLFYGPFRSWVNLKQAYHAFGDGSHDDTKAIQAALDELGKEGHSPVLFIPAGTYKITATLNMQTRTGIGIIGENPETTIIKWYGADGMKMFFLNGVSYSEYSRITWDGNNKALTAFAHEWDRKVPYANSGTSHSDEIFRNIQIGLKSGSNMDAEFTIRRCRFYKCSTGILLQGFNALDWWIWDCYFEDCAIGASNNRPINGAGNFHVYRSIFKNSTFADISLGNSEFFSFRDNVSYNSSSFIAASQFSNTSPITIQGNTIITNSNNLIAHLFTKGNVLILDNTFITPDSGENYVIDNTDTYGTPPADLMIIGNTFSAKQRTYQNLNGRTIDFDNKSIPNLKLSPNLLPRPFASRSKYPVIEISPEMSNDQIQMSINKASLAKNKTVVHFKYGNYNISKTIHIPSGAEIILTGDALASVLNWTGSTNDPIIQIEAPAKAVLQNLYLNGKNKGDCLLINDNDKEGNNIYGDQVMLYHGVQTNLFVNGFSKTDIRLDDFQHNYCENGTSIKLTGTNNEHTSLVKIFGGESSNKGNSYSLSKGARILLYDVWYENPTTSLFLKLRGNGELVMNGSKIANTNIGHEPFMDIDSFAGKIVLSEIIFNEVQKKLYFNDWFGKANLLALGNLNWSDSTNSFFDVSKGHNNYGLIHNRQNTGQGSFPLPDLGNSSAAFIKQMLTTMRETSVSEKNTISSKNNSQLILRRLMIESGINNMRVERSGN